jgi:hypothetical protein
MLSGDSFFVADWQEKKFDMIKAEKRVVEFRSL